VCTKFYSNQQSWCAKNKNKLRENATEMEIRMYQKIKSKFPKAKFQKGFLGYGKTFIIADIYIPKPYKVIIEVDGGYHNTPEIIEKDKLRDKWLTEIKGCQVIRVKNEDVPNLNINKFIRDNIICK